THRVAIANGRLLRFENGQVTFRWRDSAHHNQKKIMTLDAAEFMRRFLLHVLPRGFVKIRHFCFLANPGTNRPPAFGFCLLSCPPSASQSPRAEISSPPRPPRRVRPCSHCPGTLVLIARLSAAQLLARHLTPALDTS